MDQLAFSFPFGEIGVGPLFGQHLANHDIGGLRVAGVKTCTDQLHATVFGEHFGGEAVHGDDGALGVADTDSGRIVFNPIKGGVGHGGAPQRNF